MTEGPSVAGTAAASLTGAASGAAAGRTDGDRQQPSVSVAVDVGSLHGHRTGIGNAVAWTLEALSERDDIALLPYVVSSRAKVAAPTRRLPLPAALAHRLWQLAAPPVDRLLGRPDVVHGMNYVVPPATCARVVSVYDCWFLDHPDDAGGDVRRAGRLLRRAVDQGATVVTCSDATTQRVRSLLGTERVRTVLLGPPPIWPVPVDSAPGDPMSGDTLSGDTLSGDTLSGDTLSGDPVPVEPVSVDPVSVHPVQASRPSALDVSSSAEPPIVLSIGTVERRKNIPVLVGAFLRLAAEHETARLVVAGADGNDSATVQRAIDELPVDARSRVTLLGPVDDSTKRWLLDNAAVLAYPSLDEGFGFPLLEAQQHGLPIAASTAGSIPEIAGNAALFTEAHDTDALAANLYLAITSDTVRSELVEQGHRNVERFDWSRTADQLTTIYHELANGPST